MLSLFIAHAQEHAHEDVDGYAHEDVDEHAYEDDRPPKWLLQYEYSSLVKNGRRKKSSDILQLVVFTVDKGEDTK